MKVTRNSHSSSKLRISTCPLHYSISTIVFVCKVMPAWATLKGDVKGNKSVTTTNQPISIAYVKYRGGNYKAEKISSRQWRTIKQKMLLPVSCVLLLVALPGVTLSFCPFDLPREMLICSFIFLQWLHRIITYWVGRYQRYNSDLVLRQDQTYFIICANSRKLWIDK